MKLVVKGAAVGAATNEDGAGRALRGSTEVPGDKSLSHRALMFAAIASGDSQIRGWLPSADCLATLHAMRALGVCVGVTREPESLALLEAPASSMYVDLSVQGVGLRGLHEAGDVIDCHGSGTTMRLISGLLAGHGFVTVLTGNNALRRRPMWRIVEPLRLMGATILGRDGGRLPPLTIHGGELHGIEYHMQVASAQVKSAILLAGLYADSPTTVVEPAHARDHTEIMLSSQGAKIANDGDRITLEPPESPLRPLDLTIPGDISSAAFLAVAALLLPGSELRIEGIGVNRTRTGLLDVLRGMGARIELENTSVQGGEPVADVVVYYSALHGIEVGGEVVVRMIDEFPVLAVAATQAKGETVVRDAGELRLKESDRIRSVVAELKKMGADIDERADGFIARGPTPLKGTIVNSYNDHRLAMALTVAGLVAEGETAISQAEAIKDSFPGFASRLRELGADVSTVET